MHTQLELSPDGCDAGVILSDRRHKTERKVKETKEEGTKKKNNDENKNITNEDNSHMVDKGEQIFCAQQIHR